MTASASSGPRLAAVQVVLADSGRWGRAYVPAHRLPLVDLGALESELRRTFVDEEDEPRHRLLSRALESPVVTFETYPGEGSPVEYHTYVRAPNVSEEPLFACVLAPLAVVAEALRGPPHLVLETASFQVLDGEPTPSALTAALEHWARRLWPEREVPRIELAQWPETQLPPMSFEPSTPKPLLGAPERLTLSDYPSPEELGRP